MSQPQPQALVSSPLQSKVVEYTPFAATDPIKLTVDMVRNFIAAPTKSGAMPTERDCVKFVMLCKSRLLNPFEGDAYLIGYDSKDGPQFSLITAHQAFLKRAEAHDEYDGMESGVIVTRQGVVEDHIGDIVYDGETLIGAWATVFFKGRSHPMKKRVKLATFNKGYSRWLVDPAGMIVKVAEADALRSSFPSLMAGMYLEHEMATTIEPEKPKPLPMGRVDLRQRTNGDAHRQVLPETPAPAPPEESSGQVFPDEEFSGEAGALLDTLSDLEQRINEAPTVLDLENIAPDLTRQHDFIGPEDHQRLTKLYKERRVALEPKKQKAKT